MATATPVRSLLRSAEFRIAATYLAVGLAWVWLSDRALVWVGIQGEDGFLAAVGKGSLFVLLSAALVFGLVRREGAARARATARLQLLEACVARLNDMVLVTEADPIDEPGPRIVYANDAFLCHTGYTRDEVVGRSPRFLQGPDTGRAELDRLRDALRRRHSVRVELVNYTKERLPFIVDLEIAPVPDGTGRVTHFVAVQRDVTERKAVEAALRASVRESDLRARESARNLDAMTRLRSLGTLVAREGHLADVLASVLEAAVAIAESDFGSIQLLDPASGDLRIVAHHGFPDWWVAFWNSVSKGVGSCGTALDRGERVVIEDVTQSPVFVGTPALDAQLRAGVRAVQSTPLVDRSGKIRGMFSTHYNRPHRPDARVLALLDLLAQQAGELVAHVEAETALHDREARLAAILTTAADAIVTIDERGVIDSVNPATERLFGYPKAELVGRNVSMLMPPPYRDEHDAHLARYAATGEKRIIGVGREMEGRRQDGTVFPLDLSVSEVRDGRRWYTGIIRDASDRKRAEARLREQAELLDKVTNAVIVRSVGGRVTYWNRGAEELYGWAAAEAVGRADLPIWASDPPFWGELLAHGRWDGELTHVAKDGRTVAVRAHKSLIRAADGTPAGVIAIHIDVTERKELELRLLRAQRLESIGALASGIAHDLNNVLTPVLMAVKLLLKDRPGLDRKALLETAQASVERGAGMIRQLLAFGGGLPGEHASVSVPDLIGEVRGMLEHTLPKSIALRVWVASGVWPVTGDATQLTQVLMNLCVNARDAMPDGGTLEVAAANQALDERRAALHPGATAGRYVMLTVSDTGTGIPPGVQVRMFDPFFTTKPFGQGTGLGLATTLGIVKAHGGFVGVYSEPGKGAKFTVHLPAAVPASAPEPEADAAVPPGGHGELILVADDEPLLRTVAASVLTSAGYEVVTAANGDEAVDLYCRRQGQVAAVVLDVMMPGTGGVAALRRIRELDPNPRVVVASGLQPSAAEAELLTACGAVFVLKPYSDDDLLTAIRSVLTPAR